MRHLRRKVGERRREADDRPHGGSGERSLASERHQEWLLDDALTETFPASDPISPVIPGKQPGSDDSRRR